MIKLKEIIKESKIELGKVYTDKDKPPFKTTKQMKEELLKEGIPGLVASIDASQQKIWTEVDNISKWSTELGPDRKIQRLVLIMGRKRDDLTKSMSNLLKAVKQAD